MKNNKIITTLLATIGTAFIFWLTSSVAKIPVIESALDRVKKDREEVRQDIKEIKADVKLLLRRR